MKTLKNLSLVLAVLLTAVCLAVAGSGVVKAEGAPCGDKCSSDTSGTTNTDSSDPNCNNSSDAGVQKCIKNNQIVKDLNLIVNFLGAGVGIVVIGMIILGGIQYSIAGDNPTATGAAKQRIINALIALAAFIFTYSFLQWLIPGGVFG